MIKKYLKYLKVSNIHVLVYRMTAGDTTQVLPDPGFELKSDHTGNSARFYMDDSDKFVHNSFVYETRRILSLLGKKGPVIGDCVTSSDYRGKSIYPFVINKIAKDKLEAGAEEVFIIVTPDNTSSIRGIEKAGFRFFAEIKTQRFLLFYFNKMINWARN